MAHKNNRSQTMERCMSVVLIADAVLFVLYLIFAGKGVIWAKVLFAVLAILFSLAALGYLYLTRELTHPRSLWMTAAAAAVLICTIFSLILNYPRPKYTLQDAMSNASETYEVQQGSEASDN